jgi:hypothetical protein
LVAENSGAALTFKFQPFKALTWRSHSCYFVKFVSKIVASFALK